MVVHKHVQQSAYINCKQMLWNTSEWIIQPLMKEKKTALL